MVATSYPLASAKAFHVFTTGGNAIDAAVFRSINASNVLHSLIWPYK
jgi:gamma-glutamyltranspeptidase